MQFQINMTHLYKYSCKDIILFLNIYIKPFFSVSVTFLFVDVSSFLPMLILILLHYELVLFSQVDIIKVSVMLSTLYQSSSTFQLLL